MPVTSKKYLKIKHLLFTQDETNSVKIILMLEASRKNSEQIHERLIGNLNVSYVCVDARHMISYRLEKEKSKTRSTRKKRVNHRANHSR